MATLDLQQDLAFHAKKRLKRTIYVIMLCLALLILSAVALSLGGLSVSYGAIVKGLFVAYDPQVALIYDLRFPRIVIALLAGAGIAVSGVLFQAVLKNPISDPAIIGVCSGASFMVLLSSLLLPQLLLYGPILSFLGGGVSFLLIYGLAWKKGLHPVRIILTGIAINALFMGLSTALTSFSASASPLVNALLAGQISQKTWVDVGVLLPYTLIGLGLALLFSRICDLLLLDDQVIRNLGMDSPSTTLGDISYCGVTSFCSNVSSWGGFFFRINCSSYQSLTGGKQTSGVNSIFGLIGSLCFFASRYSRQTFGLSFRNQSSYYHEYYRRALLYLLVKEV